MRGVGCWVWAVQVHTITYLLLIFAHYDEWDSSLEWRHNGREGVSNHKRLDDCLLFVQTQIKGIIKEPVNFPHKKLVTRKMFPFDDFLMSLQYWISMLHHIVSSFMFIWNIFSLDYHYVLPHHKRGIRPLLLRWMIISPNKIDRIKRSTSTGNSVDCALLLILSVFTTSLADQWIKRQLVVNNSKGDHLSSIRPSYNITNNVYAHMYRSQEVPIWHKINLAGRL